jgi:hypothetical protein
MNIIAPITRLPPPTNCPKVVTTLPGSPVIKINRVDDIFKEIRKIVVNSSIVGKLDIDSASFAKMALNKITIATDRLNVINISSNTELIGTIMKMIAASRYKPRKILLLNLIFFMMHLLSCSCI